MRHSRFPKHHYTESLNGWFLLGWNQHSNILFYILDGCFVFLSNSVNTQGASWWRHLCVSSLMLGHVNCVVLHLPSVNPVKGRLCQFCMPQLFHKVFNLDHFGAACYGYSIIRFRRLSGLQGVDHCYFMRRTAPWILSFPICRHARSQSHL